MNQRDQYPYNNQINRQAQQQRRPQTNAASSKRKPKLKSTTKTFKSTKQPSRRHSPKKRFKKVLQLIGLLLGLSVGLLLYIYQSYGAAEIPLKIHKTNIVEENLTTYDLTPVADQFWSQSIMLSELGGKQRTLAYLDPQQRLAPASLTKILTVWVALENNEDLDQVVSIDLDVYLDMVEENASMAGFYGYEEVTVRDLIYGTMLPSGGEAAGTLALVTSGSEANFVALMNEKARSIGMYDSHFMNPVGLDHPDQYTTAADLTKLVRAACQDPDFYAVFSAPTYVSTENENHPEGVYMENSVIRAERVYELMPRSCSIVAGKSGITDDAGRCWASIIRKNNVDYIAITLGAPMYMDDPPVQLVDTAEVAKYLPSRFFSTEVP